MIRPFRRCGHAPGTLSAQERDELHLMQHCAA